MKNVNRAIRLGKFVAKPIGNFIKRSRSFSGPPPVPPKDQQSDPVARKPLRRRATISEMGDNSREKVGNDDDLPPGLRCLKGPHCPCWKCTETTRFLNGQYDVDPNRPYDPFFGGTGAHGYNEEWDEWNKRIDFIRYKSQMPPEALDLRRRTRPRDAQYAEQAAGHPTSGAAFVPAPAPDHQHHNRSNQRPPVPPPPVMPEHVSSYKPNSRLLNSEQEYWIKQQADWKAARLQEVRDLGRHQTLPTPTPRERVDQWRRTTEPVRQPPQDRSRSKSRKPPPVDPPTDHPPEIRRRHRSRQPPPPQNDDDDPFCERALDRARITEVHRRAEPNPAPPVKQKPKPTSKPVDRAPREDQRGHVSRYVDVANLTNNDMARFGRAAARFFEQQAQGIEPTSDMRAREVGRAEERRSGPADVEVGKIGRVPHPSRRHRHETKPSGGPVDHENVVTIETSYYEKVRVPGHLYESAPLPHPTSGRPPKPSRPEHRPTTLKAIPSLPKFPSLPADSESGRSRSSVGSRRAHYTVIPPPAPRNDIPPPPRRTQRGAVRSDQSEVDGDSICDAPRAGDEGWREDWDRTQRESRGESWRPRWPSWISRTLRLMLERQLGLEGGDEPSGEIGVEYLIAYNHLILFSHIVLVDIHIRVCTSFVLIVLSCS
jgi:hypothetical protein